MNPSASKQKKKAASRSRAGKARARKGIRNTGTGKLRIGDDWNAITIIALSQSNPLKAVAEFVENSIDAGANRVLIVRGKEKGQSYLRIVDNGRGIPKNKDGEPDFKYVATHICDSIKRQLKSQGDIGMQGEFGIGLLSFWTVGENLIMRSGSDSDKTFEMVMSKGDPSYAVNSRKLLLQETGTELMIKPLLPGLRQFSGEKIQKFLAGELRDRIIQNHVEITITDKTARKQFIVEPKQFPGQRITDVPLVDTAVAELYLNEPAADNVVSLYREGTRVLTSITDLEGFNRAPWNSPYLVGLIDAPHINLTPGTRMGVIRDLYLDDLQESLKPVEQYLLARLDAQEKAEEEKASKEMLHTISKAFREAMIMLPVEEYDWFELNAVSGGEGNLKKQNSSGASDTNATNTADGAQTGVAAITLGEEPTATADVSDDTGREAEAKAQQSFFESLGPLTSLRISPASTVIQVGRKRNFRLVARDHKRREIDREIQCEWSIVEGRGLLERTDREVVTFVAPAEPCLTRLCVIAREGKRELDAEALVTVTDSLVEPATRSGDQSRGMPAYSFEHQVGALWRSRFDEERNLIFINSGHRDFVYASKNKSLKLRYICRLFAKELVLANFSGMPPDQLLERMLEISLYTEENLR